MDRAEIERRAQAIICEELGVDCAQVTSDARLGEDLAADALDAATIAMRAEDAFAIEIDPERDAEIIACTFGGLCDMIERLACSG